ncbi:hypothetical protein RO07_18580 [Pandoraea pulmonicola]|uniref:Uncharacterized protein n=1 Tax=Pandoraea pulmonicola TaxID=93221 RepID=A0ABM5S2L4_PANPU|nr:hypothetical protein RO07_18580 [Pandoraea pulmonicola]
MQLADGGLARYDTTFICHSLSLAALLGCDSKSTVVAVDGAQESARCPSRPSRSSLPRRIAAILAPSPQAHLPKRPIRPQWVRPACLRAVRSPA